MSKIDQIKSEIENLPGEELRELYRWLADKDWELWDKELEADAKAGRLDYLRHKALEEKSAGTLTDL
jgi:hypothetical protein